MKTARHQVITCPLRGALDQNWRFHLNKPPGIEKIANKLHHPVAKEQIRLHPRPPQVKVAVLEAEPFIYLIILIYIERRCLGSIEYLGTISDNLDLTGR